MAGGIRNEEGEVQKVKNGGPAFPLLGYDRAAGGGFQPTPTIYVGLSMLDYFAAHALTGIMLNEKPVSGGIENYNETVARQAYWIAEAMLQERNEE